jgi:ATP-dependent DNA helicase RecG
VIRNVNSLASTTNGKFYIRVADVCKPVMPEDIARVAADKNTFVWEESTAKRVEIQNVDEKKLAAFLYDVRSSLRVSAFVKEKSDEEILDYYGFQKGGFLTNLGILWIGERRDRTALQFAPAVQVIRYNERDEKVWKMMLDDYYLNPKEILESILHDVPDWQETIEIPDGAYRRNIPFYPEAVIRELCTNALVHRTYTARGDIFINIYHDRLEIHNPGTLPYGVTPRNILSRSVRRNENLSKVCYDLNLMEKEGSGYDMIYASLLRIGKALPTVYEEDDRVVVTVQKDFVSRDIILLMNKAIDNFALKQKEIITLGLLAQKSYSATELSKLLNQNEEQSLRTWLGNLLEYGMVKKTGDGKATIYAPSALFFHPKDNNQTESKTSSNTSLEQVLTDIIRNQSGISFGEIHKKIEDKVNIYKLRRILKQLIDNQILTTIGINKGLKYYIKHNDVRKT